MTHTLVGCDCKTVVHPDGSGVEIEFCNLHWAAPELLDMCVAVEEWVTELFVHFGLDQDTAPRLHKLRAIIHKARGEQS